MKKKTIGATACAVSLILCLASCGGKAEQIASAEQNTAAENETTLAKIEVASDGTYDTGMFSFKVPGNWLIVEQPDTLGEQDETGNYPVDAKSICIVKDGEDEFDALFKHCEYIYYEEGEITDDVVETNISMYGEAEEFDLKINERECRAAHCSRRW